VKETLKKCKALFHRDLWNKALNIFECLTYGCIRVKLVLPMIVLVSVNMFMKYHSGKPISTKLYKRFHKFTVIFLDGVKTQQF